MATNVSEVLVSGGMSLIKSTALSGTGVHTFDKRTKLFRVFMLGGAGGGCGGGARNEGGEPGGGGGAPGEHFEGIFNAEAFGLAVAFSCGAGGLGGIGAIATGTTGPAQTERQPGANGGDTTFGVLRAKGGGGAAIGAQGLTSTFYNPVDTFANQTNGVRIAFGGSPNAANSTPDAYIRGTQVGAGGGGGGHANSSNFNGQSGGANGVAIASGGLSSQSITQAENGQQGDNGNLLAFIPGGGGGGGGAGRASSSGNRTGGKGGDGGPGAGGGGGGGAGTSSGAVATATGGKGGNGGNGAVVIWEFG